MQTTPQIKRLEIAFIDTRLNHYEQLVQALSPSMQVVLIDENQDGLSVIAQTLHAQEYSGATSTAGNTVYDAVHIFRTAAQRR